MKVYGQLEFAQLENLASDPASAPFGRMYINTTDTANGVAKFHDGTRWKAMGEAQPGRLDVASASSITAMANTSNFIKLTGSTATTLHGITAGKDNQRVILFNATGANLTVKNESATDSAANRITTMTGADIATTANGAAEFVYDTGSSRWICILVST